MANARGNGMHVVFRLEADAVIGGGHAMRCLALADELLARGHQTTFAFKSMPEQLQATIARAGHALARLEGTAAAGSSGEAADAAAQEADACTFRAGFGANPPDWVVVDHYGLDAVWEQAVADVARHVMAVDDLGRLHDCDIVLDQNYHERPEGRYAGRIARPDCTLLLGPAYALLRPAFYRPGIARERSGEVHKLLVTFGAGDPTGQTAKIAEALLSLPEGRLHTDILADPSAVPSAIVGAGGITAWERCTLGLPALVITTADNQRPSMTALSAAGAIQLLGAADSVTVDDIKHALLQLLNDSQRVAAMSRRALAVGVGSGPASAADAMEALR